MKPAYPPQITKALESGVNLFMGDSFEWKLEVEEDARFIEEYTGTPVLAFANNGCGDYLFLKNSGSKYETIVLIYLHEGPEIEEVQEDLDTLFGFKERPPSNDDYPNAIYSDGKCVMIGDLVEFKVWIQFWKGWQEGKVTYLPGHSKKRPSLESNGLKWIEISSKDWKINPLIDPSTGIVRNVRFVDRISSNE